MRDVVRISLLLIPLLFLGCRERTEQHDSGGVLLEVDFGAELTYLVSVNTVAATSGALVQTTILNITNIVSDPDGGSSQLMDVELETLEVTFERVDGGTRVPPPYVVNILGTVPANGSFGINNMELLTWEQIEQPPLSDLLYENGGYDKETGLTRIKMNLWIRVFGRTLAGRAVESVPRPHTMLFVQ